VASAPPAAPAAPLKANGRRRRPWRWLAALAALALLAAVANGLWQRRPTGRELAVSEPAQQQGAVSVAVTYVASLERYPLLPDVPAWVQPAYLRAPVVLRRLFDAAYGFFVPRFRRPPPGDRFLEVVCTGRAPVHAQPGFGPGQDPVLGAAGAATRVEELFWAEPGVAGVFRLRLLFSLPANARAESLALSIGGEHFTLHVPEP